MFIRLTNYPILVGSLYLIGPSNIYFSVLPLNIKNDILYQIIYTLHVLSNLVKYTWIRENTRLTLLFIRSLSFLT